MVWRPSMELEIRDEVLVCDFARSSICVSVFVVEDWHVSWAGILSRAVAEGHCSGTRCCGEVGYGYVGYGVYWY